MAIYKQNIPQPTDLLAVSQIDLLSNASYLDTFLDVEHQQSGRDNAALGSGRHKTVSMPNQGADPAVPGGTTGIVYQKANELFHRNATRISQLTGNFSQAVNGYYVLPGGLTIQWGVRNAPGQSGSVVFPIAFPTACFNVQLTQRRDASNSTQGMYVNGLPSTTGFNYNGSTNSDVSLYWYAIGN